MKQLLVILFLFFYSVSINGQTSAEKIITNLVNRTSVIQILPPHLVHKSNINKCISALEVYNSVTKNLDTTESAIGVTYYDKNGFCAAFWTSSKNQIGENSIGHFIKRNKNHQIIEIGTTNSISSINMLDSLLKDKNSFYHKDQYREPNFWEAVHEFEYNTKGLLKTYQLFKGRYVLPLIKEEFEYNAEDSLINFVQYISESNKLIPYIQINFKYIDNKLVETSHVESNSNEFNNHYSYPNDFEVIIKQESKSCTLSETQLTKNKKGQLIRFLTKKLDAVQETICYEYNSLGKLKKMKVFSDNTSKSPDTKEFYFYKAELPQKRKIVTVKGVIEKKWLFKKALPSTFFYKSVQDNRLKTFYKVNYQYQK